MQYIEVKDLYNRLKNSAKRRGIPFELTPVDIYDLPLPLRCPILDIPLKYNRGAAKDDSFSIDRIDSTIGYTRDNIIVISNRANRIKNNGTAEELKLLAEFYENLVI
jgi:hypothetical protein